MADTTQFASDGNSGTRVFSNVAGGRFENVDIDRMVVDNQISNPTLIKVSGNSGVVSNGDNNALGANRNAASAPVSVVKRGSYKKDDDYSSSSIAAAPPVTSSSQPPAYHPAPPAETKPQVVETPNYSPTVPAAASTPYSSASPVATPYVSSASLSSTKIISATYVAPPVVSSTPVSSSATGYVKSSY